MNLFFTESARKDLNELLPEIKQRILEKLSFFMAQNNPLSYAKEMVNNDFGQYRFRIGDYRAIFDVKKDQLVVLVIGHRKDIYN